MQTRYLAQLFRLRAAFRTLPLFCYERFVHLGSRNFYVRKFISVNEIEAMYERPHVNVKVEPRSTFTLTRDRPYIASILFRSVKFACVRA